MIGLTMASSAEDATYTVQWSPEANGPVVVCGACGGEGGVPNRHGANGPVLTINTQHDCQPPTQEAPEA